MVTQEIYIPKYRWRIHAFFAVSEYWVEPIMDLLWELDCDSERAKKAYDNLTSGELNNGLCYSNYKMRESVLVVSKSTSSAEFINSLHHELVHLQSHIAHECNLDPQGEEIAYLSGDIIMRIYPHVAYLLCDKCRNKYLDYEKE